MARRVSRILTAAAALYFLLLMVWAAPSFFDPEFEVINHAPEVVAVVAAWRGDEMDVGAIQPMDSRTFSVNDEEGVIRFIVHYPSGKTIESEPKYFTRGTTIIATIDEEHIDVRYDIEH